MAHYGSANEEFADASVRRNKQMGVLIAGVPYPLFPIPLPFPLPPNPLPLSTPATQAVFSPSREAQARIEAWASALLYSFWIIHVIICMEEKQLS